MYRGVVTAVSAITMIWGPQVPGIPKSVITVPLTGLPYLKRDPEGILIQGPLRSSYASADDNIPVNPDIYVVRDDTDWIPHITNVPGRFMT
ncbi:hypothetical protein TNCV_1998691 [Trichonephila clavipes]|nr:hypothetical protein TNCV_1998691 [Trichonephila clavipes]